MVCIRFRGFGIRRVSEPGSAVRPRGRNRRPPGQERDDDPRSASWRRPGPGTLLDRSPSDFRRGLAQPGAIAENCQIDVAPREAGLLFERYRRWELPDQLRYLIGHSHKQMARLAVYGERPVPEQSGIGQEEERRHPDHGTAHYFRKIAVSYQPGILFGR